MWLSPAHEGPSGSQHPDVPYGSRELLGTPSSTCYQEITRSSDRIDSDRYELPVKANTPLSMSETDRLSQPSPDGRIQIRFPAEYW